MSEVYSGSSGLGMTVLKKGRGAPALSGWTYSHALKVCLVRQGKGRWQVEDRSYAVCKGDIVLFNNMEKRKLEVSQEGEDFLALIAEFEPRFIWGTCGNAAEPNCLRPFLNRPPGFENLFRGDSPSLEKVRQLMEEMEEEQRQKASGYKQIMKGMLLNILALIARQTEQGSHMPFHALNFHKRAEEMEEVLDYIDRNLSEEMTLAKLAAVAHLHPDYFSAVFKKMNGLCLSQYIISRRIANAAGLLRFTDRDIMDIMYGSGFRSVSNFYKSFKTVTGHTPLEFRNKARQIQT